MLDPKQQRYLESCVQGLKHELHLLPESLNIAHLRESRIQYIQMWADKIVRAAEELMNDGPKT